MRHRILPALLVILAIGVPGLCAARERIEAGPDIPWPPWWSELPPVESHTRAPSEPYSPVVVDRPSAALLEMLTSWLATNFALPHARELPRVELVPRMRLAALRYRGLASDRAPSNGRTSPLDELDMVHAVYDQRKRTIYLPDDWHGESPAEISVLVHELVHHLQNVAGARYGCAQEGERPAYEAQARWLAMFGKTLHEFGIDSFDVLVRTRCFN